MAKAPGPIQQARSIVQPQYASVDYASRKAAQRSSAEQRALTASGKALVNLLQQGVGPAGQMYDQAVGQQQALAQGAAQLLAQQNPNAQIQGDLARIDAPPEQQAQLAHSLQAQFPGQGAVLNVQQGAIPGASLIAQKAAEQGYLAGLPTLAALSGQQSLRGLLAKAADQQQALQAQRLQISGQIPTLALGIANTAAQRQAAAASAQAEAAYRQAELDARAQSQADLNAYRQNEFSQRNASQASLDRYRQRQLNTRTGSRSNPKIIGSSSAGYYAVSPDGKSLTQILPPNSAVGGNKGLTANEKYQAFEKTRGKVLDQLGLTPTSSSGSIFGGVTNSNFNVPKNERTRAYNRLYGLYSGPLVRAGVSRASIKAMLNTALNEAGFVLPGKKVDSRGQRVG